MRGAAHCAPLIENDTTVFIGYLFFVEKLFTAKTC